MSKTRALILFILLPLMLGCVEEIQVKEGMKPVVVLYSARKEHYVGIDAAGRPTVAKYIGPRSNVLARVVDVHLPGRSPSVAIEDATVLFSVVGGHVSGFPDSMLIELRFDEHASPGNLIIGDSWEILLTDEGELIDLRPVVKTGALR